MPSGAWGNPESTPIDDIRSMIETVMRNSGGRPNQVVMPWPQFMRWMRRTMPKRAFRRWRGKVRERMRLRRIVAAQRAFCGCAPGHRMCVAAQVCIDCGFTERDLYEGGNRRCR